MDGGGGEIGNRGAVLKIGRFIKINKDGSKKKIRMKKTHGRSPDIPLWAFSRLEGVLSLGLLPAGPPPPARGARRNLSGPGPVSI